MTIISGIITFFVGRYNGRHNLRYQNLLSASKEFTNAFTNTQVFLEESDKSNVFEKIETINIKVVDFIDTKIEIQQRAYIQFLPYLGFINKRRFRNVWEDYANPKEKNKKTRFSETSASLNRYVVYSSNSNVEERENRTLVKKKINKLLAFAKTK